MWCSPCCTAKNGEDGTMQGLLQLSGIPFVGCRALSSAVCMDKAVTHSLLEAARIEQAHYLWFYADLYHTRADVIKNKIARAAGLPRVCQTGQRRFVGGHQQSK